MTASNSKFLSVFGTRKPTDVLSRSSHSGSEQPAAESPAHLGWAGAGVSPRRRPMAPFRDRRRGVRNGAGTGFVETKTSAAARRDPTTAPPSPALPGKRRRQPGSERTAQPRSPANAPRPQDTHLRAWPREGDPPRCPLPASSSMRSGPRAPPPDGSPPPAPQNRSTAAPQTLPGSRPRPWDPARLPPPPPRARALAASAQPRERAGAGLAAAAAASGLRVTRSVAATCFLPPAPLPDASWPRAEAAGSWGCAPLRTPHLLLAGPLRPLMESGERMPCMLTMLNLNLNPGILESDG